MFVKNPAGYQIWDDILLSYMTTCPGQ